MEESMLEWYFDNFIANDSSKIQEEEEEVNEELSQELMQDENIVSTAKLGCQLDLNVIARKALNVKYDPKTYKALTMRIRKPLTTAIIYKSGNIVCLGAKSEEESRIAARRYARIVQKLGFPVRFLDFRIQTMVASCKIFPINFEQLVLAHHQQCSYEPELFPGLFYRVMPGISVTIFANGKLSVNGFSLWDETTLRKSTNGSCNGSSQFQITAADTIDSKSSLLDVEASLKASFLCGLIEVKGSANYLNDQKKFKTQSRVTLRSGRTNEDHWYFSDEVLTKMRKKVKAFHDVAKGLKDIKQFRFLIGALENKKYTGFSLWDKTTLEENTTETPKPGCEFQIMAEDTIDSKSSLLDVEASLKVSVLSGLIKVEGSAKYLNDQKKFKNQSRVTLQYKATTHFKQLSMTELGTQNTQQTDVIKKSSATHVVTGIQYGANAFFVFDSEKLEDSKVQDTQVGMEAVIKKIPSCKPGVEARIQLTDEEKVLTDKFSCKFYGDLLLESNPATFDEAVKTCKELPKLLGKKGENAVPLKVWLMPLKNFDSEAAELKREISVGLMMKAKDALEGVEQTEMRCNDSLADRVSDDFPQMREMLSSFQKLCHNYTSALQQDIKKALPSIREGKEDESSLEKLFEDRDKSPFSQENLNKLMDHKGREINVIRCCVDIINGTGAKIVQSKAELEREVLTPGVEDALCFVFTSLGSTDPFLDAMTKYLDSPEEGSTDEDYGYISDEVLTKMREKAKYFHDVAKGLKDSKRFRFLVAALENKEYTGATIYHYKEGSLVTDDFTKPDVPDVRTAHDRRDLIWYVKVCRSGADCVSNRRVEASPEDRRRKHDPDRL
eukprot:superscaffoldBa00001953_g12638